MQRDDDDRNSAAVPNNNQNNNRKYLAIMVMVQLFLYMYFQIRQQQQQQEQQKLITSESNMNDHISSSTTTTLFRTNNYFYSSKMNTVINSVVKDPRDQTLLKIAAHIYFLPLKRYVYNLIGDDSDDQFEKTTQYVRFSQFLYPDLEHFSTMGIHEKLASENHDEFDFFRSPSSDPIITYEKAVTRCDLELFVSKSCLRKKIPQDKPERKQEQKSSSNENSYEKLKNLRDAYLKETLRDPKKLQFLKQLNSINMQKQHSREKVDDDIQHIDTLREESITISHSKSLKDPTKIHVTDILHVTPQTDAKKNHMDIIQEHFNQISMKYYTNSSANNNSSPSRVEFMLSLKQKAIAIMLQTLQDLKDVHHIAAMSSSKTKPNNNLQMNPKTGDISSNQIVPSIYLVIASSPQLIKSWFSFKVEIAFNSVSYKRLVKQLNSLIQGQDLTVQLELSTLNCNARCRRAFIQSYHIFSKCSQVKTITFNIVNNDKYRDESKTRVTDLSISIFNTDGSMYGNIQHLKCSKKYQYSCAKEVIHFMQQQQQEMLPTGDNKKGTA
ncbi:hypothetical protein C9374_001468 [Naegleria lovaniensis]|uniref:Uncharacterized protein n=1 Tax=Naegleria lovaniensis TaxID=51637 RepID=A0AA88GY94_NAELO|nr:uncharacterized protein C9374_001468 [Naegleria lovaniensis]KAG2387874.1 hypothetical protein C9374_001468 [Naegleria lovaniensis]